jgi:hypothetical protein
MPGEEREARGEAEGARGEERMGALLAALGAVDSGVRRAGE